MKAVLCKEFGPPETLVVEDIPSPTAGKGEVVLSVHAAAVNFPDVLIIENKYQFKPPLPFAPGGEVAGTVKEVGEGVTTLKVGDRVIGSCGHGGYLAIGSCLSALTRNQVIAFVISVVACFLFTVSGAPLVLDVFRAWAPQVLINTLASLSLLTHFKAITGGVIDLRDVVFFVTLIGGFLVATMVIVDMKKGEGA